MAHLEISLDGFVKELKTSSNGSHARKFCFVLGSGASKESGIPTGGELVNIWDRELTERNKEVHEAWKQDNGITKENKASFYSRFYRRRYGRNPSDGKNFLEKNMEEVLPNMGHFYLAYLLSKTKNRIVITTNFDRLVENAINDFTSALPLVIGHDTLTDYVGVERERPVVLKIHNDLLFDPKNTEEETEKLSEGWRKALDRVFQEYSPVFLGYGGNDRSVMDFLTDNAGKFQSGEWKCPYWTASTEFSKRNENIRKFLDEAEGYYIQTSRFSNTMRRIGEEYGHNFPSEEEYLQEAKTKYQKIKAEQYLTETQRKECYSQVESLYENHNFEDALQLLQTLLKQEPENALYLHDLGYTLNALRRYSEAVDINLKALTACIEKFGPDSDEVASTYNNLGYAYFFAEDHEKAMIYLEKACTIWETISDSGYLEDAKNGYRNLAYVYAAMGDADKAAEYRHKANASPQPKT